MLSGNFSVEEAATYIGLLLALAGFFCAPSGTFKGYFRFWKEDFGTVALGTGLLATLAIVGIRYLLQFGGLVLTNAAGEAPPDFAATSFTLSALFLTCLQSPFFEELTFRGLSLELFRRLGRLRLVVFVSCLLFALTHISRYGWTAAVAAFLLGTILCSLRLRSNSLLAPLLVHFLMNLYVFAVNWVGKQFFTSQAVENARTILPLNIAFAATGLFFVLIGWKSLDGIIRSLWFGSNTISIGSDEGA